jgi:hypothetical protein
MSKQPLNSPGGIWAITSYFNPIGYRARRANYEVFQQHLNVPLLTVEQGQDGNYKLNPEDADVLVQVPAHDVMWQKERLLNLALKALPAECQKVAWLDCDIIFERDDWADLVVATLEHSKLVQLFGKVCFLPREVDLSHSIADQYFLRCPSAASGSVDGTLGRNELVPTVEGLEGVGMASDVANGFAWVMRRELLEQFGFYDASIIGGGGDYKFSQAALGQYKTTGEFHLMNASQFEHYLEWATPLYQAVQGKIGIAPGNIYHLWHGEFLGRQYKPRHLLLNQHDFDPYQDIAIDEHGCWRWNSNKPALHQAIRDYFKGRREDGH